MVYGFVGLGLMGGSFAKAIRRSSVLFPPVPLMPPGVKAGAQGGRARIVDWTGLRKPWTRQRAKASSTRVSMART
jgi:hypothetical protein